MKTIFVFAEGGFREVSTKATLEEARAFADGIVVGAYYYGAGSIRAFVMPDDESDLCEFRGTSEVQRLREKYPEAFGPQVKDE